MSRMSPDDIKSYFAQNDPNHPDYESSKEDSSKDDKEKDDKKKSKDNKEDSQGDETDNEKGEKDALEKIKESKATLQKAKLTGAGAGAATGASMAAAALEALKNFLMMIANMLQSVATAIAQAASGIISTIIKGFNFIASKLAAAGKWLGGVLGVSAKTGTAVVVAGTLSVTGVGAAAGVVVLEASQVSERDFAYYEDCAEDAEAALSSIHLIGDPSEMELQNAKKIHSALRAYGMTNTHVAGVVGNFSAESNIDSSMIEAIYGERFSLGPKKQAALQNPTGHVENVVFPYWARAGVSLNKSAYSANDGKKYAGHGLGQWTGESARNLLDFARQQGLPWYSVDLQLIYMLSPNGDTSQRTYLKGWLEEWTQSNPGTPSDAAYSFGAIWEGNTHNMGGRKASAERWFVTLSEMEVDMSYGNTILSRAETAAAAAGSDGVAKALQDCAKVNEYDNSSIAMAAASFSWPTIERSRGNDGTPLYIKLHREIFPSDSYPRSCDRTAATAIRWAGADDTFPIGNVSAQLAYISTSPKWEKVTEFTGDPSVLLPGDILFGPGHIVVHAGEAAIQLVHGQEARPGSILVHGSHGDTYQDAYSRGPGAGPWYIHPFTSAFRNIQRETNPKYIHLGGGASTLPTPEDMVNPPQ